VGKINFLECRSLNPNSCFCHRILTYGNKLIGFYPATYTSLHQWHFFDVALHILGYFSISWTCLKWFG
jgi:hypothetical protein